MRGYIDNIEQSVMQLKARAKVGEDILHHQILSNVRYIHSCDILQLPKGYPKKNPTVTTFLARCDARCTELADLLEQRSASVQTGVKHLIESLTSGFSKEDKSLVEEKKLLDGFQEDVMVALESATVRALRKLRKRVASGVAASFIFIHPPLFQVQAQLKIPDVQLSPNLDTVQVCVNKAAKKVISMTKSIILWEKRGLQPVTEQNTFFAAIGQRRALIKVILQLNGTLSSLRSRVDAHLDVFERYGFLWKVNLSEHLVSFLKGDPRPAL